MVLERLIVLTRGNPKLEVVSPQSRPRGMHIKCWEDKRPNLERENQMTTS